MQARQGAGGSGIATCVVALRALTPTGLRAQVAVRSFSLVTDTVADQIDELLLDLHPIHEHRGKTSIEVVFTSAFPILIGRPLVGKLDAIDDIRGRVGIADDAL
jgi:hypothetical protein